MSWRSLVLETLVGSWNLQFWPLVLTIIVSAVYLRGFIGAHRSTPDRFPLWRAGAFLLVSSFFYAILSRSTNCGYLLSVTWSSIF